MAEVHLEQIVKRIGAAEIIPDLTLTVRKGELFTLLGPSGCGKSTLLQMIAGLDRPTTGRILFDGEDMTTREPRERDVAMVFQAYALYPHMTVAENLAFPLRVGRRTAPLEGRTIDEEVRRVAGFLNIEGLLARRPRELSGGQRQRVALGRALIRRPRVFLLDEPLSNLDAQLRTDMRAELRRLHDELGVTMIYVTHDQVEAMTLADRVAVLDRGRVQQIGRPHELYEAPRNLFVAGFIGHPSMNTFEASIQRDHAAAGPLRVPVPAEINRRYGGRRVCIGLRPEDVRITAAAMPDPSGQIRAVVRLIEPTGGQTWVTCELAGVPAAGDHPRPLTIVGLADRRFEAKPGERVAVAVQKDAVHIFDPDTGMRIMPSSVAA
ncbi:ABC transporter ATP-binding protein [Candidatus Nitrospira bockiana]